MGGGTLLAHEATSGGVATSDLVLIACSLVFTALVCWIYVRGLLRIRQHEQGWRRHKRRSLAFAGGIAVTLVVSLPPLSEILEQRLSTHMAQHMAYITIAAPLLAVAAPGQPLLAGLPGGVRRRITSTTRRLPVAVFLAPHVAWTLQIAALWLWHLPAAYDLALRFEVVHELEHLTFLSTAWLFWWHVATLSRRRLRGPAAMLYVTAAILPGAALGALLTFASRPLYPTQAAAATASGVNPLFDQRIGGLVMWIPLDYAYLVVAVWLFSRWFKGLQLGGLATYDTAPSPVPTEVNP